jgi:hypothetical protein
MGRGKAATAAGGGVGVDAVTAATVVCGGGRVAGGGEAGVVESEAVIDLGITGLAGVAATGVIDLGGVGVEACGGEEAVKEAGMGAGGAGVAATGGGAWNGGSTWPGALFVSSSSFFISLACSALRSSSCCIISVCSCASPFCSATRPARIFRWYPLSSSERPARGIGGECGLAEHVSGRWSRCACAGGLWCGFADES